MKTILITGSTDGIGKLVAIRFANEGHQVFLHGRNQHKLMNVLSEIKAKTNNENIDGFVADFSDLMAVNKMADEILIKISKIDILINNAGIFKSPINTTKDGFDIRFAVNYLAPFLLTNKLLSILKSGRIINLSSAAQATVSINALTGNETLSVNEAYAQSKLAITIWSFYLAKIQQDKIIIAVNPGSLLNTKMANDAYGQYWSPANKGSDILYDLSILDTYKYDSGKYFDNDRGYIADAHPDTFNEKQTIELIKETEKILFSLM